MVPNLEDCDVVVRDWGAHPRPTVNRSDSGAIAEEVWHFSMLYGII
jgi:hypothetical protein